MRRLFGSMPLDEKAINRVLSSLNDPAGQALLESPHLAGLHIGQERVTLVLDIKESDPEAMALLRKEIETRLQEIAGTARVLVTLTAEKTSKPLQPQTVLLPHVKSIIAVASGKGGVGKSTTAANLALAFAARGLSVGLLDADIYGPSVPHLFSLTAPPEKTGDGRIEPATACGMKLMSIGLMVEPDMPLIWRGPMLDKALTQFLRDVNWGALDLLIIDMPPGTGDAQISLTRRLAIDGAIIVSTPQDLALLDARKGVELFNRAGVPVLGFIENMSTFVCPACGARCDIFAHGGARMEAEKLGLPFLGEVPLHMSIRESADAGMPLMISAPDSAEAQAYVEIADEVLRSLQSSAANAVVRKA